MRARGGERERERETEREREREREREMGIAKVTPLQIFLTSGEEIQGFFFPESQAKKIPCNAMDI
jgi:hypothetical protein